MKDTVSHNACRQTAAGLRRGNTREAAARHSPTTPTLICGRARSQRCEASRQGPRSHSTFGWRKRTRRSRAIETSPQPLLRRAITCCDRARAGGFRVPEQALRLSPRDPGRNIWQWQICNAHAHLAQWAQAIEWFQKSAATNPELFWPYFELAAAYGWLGRSGGRRQRRGRTRKRKPDATVQRYRALQDFPNPKFATERDRIMEGAAQSGVAREPKPPPSRSKGEPKTAFALPSKWWNSKVAFASIYRFTAPSRTMRIPRHRERRFQTIVSAQSTRS